LDLAAQHLVLHLVLDAVQLRLHPHRRQVVVRQDRAALQPPLLRDEIDDEGLDLVALA